MPAAGRCSSGWAAPFKPETLVGQLSIAEQQLVEIARALHAKSKILVLDEPTTALSSRETERLFALIRQLRAEGIALIYISHRMAEVYELSDRVSVLRDGTYVGTLDRAELSAEALVKMMVGRDLSSFYKKEHDPHGSRGPVHLEVRGHHRRRPAGQALQLPAARGRGAGHRRPGRLRPHRAGAADLRCRCQGRAARSCWRAGRCHIQRPKDALDAGIAYLTEDRKALGPVPRHVLRREHQCRRDRPRRPRLAACSTSPQAKKRAEAAFQALRVRAASPLVTVGSLSGGNQQKVLLSRWLEIGPKVLILDEPTRGVDIGAKSEIYRIIDELAQAGHRRRS